MDALLYEVTGLAGIFLLPESDESSDNVSNESSEDKKSDEIIIVFCAIRTRSSPLIVFMLTRSFYLIASL